MISVQFPLGYVKTALFLNGSPRQVGELIPLLDSYQQVIAVDGAWNKLTQQGGDEYIDLVLGDGDSILARPSQFVELADQNFTDFEKVILHLIILGITEVDVYWAGGGEMDHFLGNLSVAAKYGHQIHCRFFDEKQCYFYTREDCQIFGADGHTISIYPFPKTLVSSHGLLYEMDKLLLKQYEQQSLRNQLMNNEVLLSLHGNAFIFLSIDSNKKI